MTKALSPRFRPARPTTLLQLSAVRPARPRPLLRDVLLVSACARSYRLSLWCCGRALQIGEMMAEFPLDPQLAKMLVTSPDFRCSGGRGDGVDSFNESCCTHQ